MMNDPSSTSASPTARQHSRSPAFVREARKLDRLKHRLDVLLLVLDDEAEGEAAVESGSRVELDLLEHRERPRTNFGEVRCAAVGSSSSSEGRSSRSWANAS